MQSDDRSRRLLVRGALTLDPGAPSLEEQDVLIEGGVITEVGRHLAAAGVDEEIDARGMLVMPGLINSHTHSGQNLDRGMAPNLPLDLWLIWVVYGGFETTPDDAYTLAMAGALEMLRSGCTAVLDHVWIPTEGFEEHAEAVMSAYVDAGIRAGVAPMIQDRDIFESMSVLPGEQTPEPFGPPTDPTLLVEKMEWFFDQWQGRLDRLQPIVGPSAPQRCSDELMASLSDLARRRQSLFHTHVLETKPQIFATRERYGRSIVEVLAELGLMNPRSSLAHCVWMDPSEFDAVRSSGVVVVHNPISNLRCGSGLLPLSDLLTEGVKVALGCDGAASNDNQNMFEVLKFAGLIHTLYGDHRDWPTAEMVWRAALDGGAAALGTPLGSIRAGAKADLALLTLDRHVAVDRTGLISSLVLAEHGESVHTVIVDGVVVVDDGTSTRVDEREAARRSRELQSRIHAAKPSRLATYERYESYLCALTDRAMETPTEVNRLAAVSPAFRTE